jgi:hypothetical protein
MSGVIASSLVAHVDASSFASSKPAGWFATDEAGGQSNHVLTIKGEVTAYGVESTTTEDIVNIVLTTGEVLALTPDYGVLVAGHDGIEDRLVRADSVAARDGLVGGGIVDAVQKVHAVGGWEVSHLLVESAPPYAIHVGKSLVYVQRVDRPENEQSEPVETSEVADDAVVDSAEVAHD